MAQRLKRLPPMQKTQVRSLGQEDPLEKEMVTHSRILAWRIPWTETDSACKVEYMFSTCSVKLNSELIGKTFIIFFFPFLFQQKVIIEP